MTVPSTRPLPTAVRRSLLIYNFLFPLVFLALLPGFLVRMCRRGGYREKFLQRLGRYSAADGARLASKEWIWMHSISVGETLLALKLARKIRDIEPATNVVISVTTSTGFAVAQPAVCDWLEVIYNPVDLRSIVRMALDAVRPRRLIFIEAIWPNLLAEAHRRGIPTAFVPRLSPRSERRFRRIRALVGPFFGMLDSLAVAEPADVARWRSLGVAEERITVTGNSKFDHADGVATRVDEFRAVLQRCGVATDSPVLLAGSTFPGEERIVAEVFRELRAEFPGLFLILVPRHVERTEDVLSDLRPLSLRIALRDSPEDRPVDALIVNTTGELRDWYHLADVVFIGKSLTSTGGQNPVEAVLADKPVVFGPHMENFEPLVGQWLAADAAIRVGDAPQLRAQLGALLRDPARRAALAARARSIAAVHIGASDRTVWCLLAQNGPARDRC